MKSVDRQKLYFNLEKTLKLTYYPFVVYDMPNWMSHW